MGVWGRCGGAGRVDRGGDGMSKRIIRVFPRRTKATPVDELAVVGREPGLFDEADEVHISVAFTWDMPEAERLEKHWRFVAPVKIGGPATGERSGAFVPGMYVRDGFTITSRGCPNKCWFCSVWKREGVGVRELPIQDGWNVLDDNLLACSDEHVKSVFTMLSRQPHFPMFTGGLEAKILKPWHCEWLRKLKPKRLYFAYDTPDDYEPLVQAGIMLRDVGFTASSHALCCYVLCGYPKDNLDSAESRMHQTIEAGFTPMAMLYRDKQGDRNQDWMRWARQWARPAIIHSTRGCNRNEIRKRL